MTQIVSPSDRRKFEAETQRQLRKEQQTIPDIQRGPTTGFMDSLKSQYRETGLLYSFRADANARQLRYDQLITEAGKYVKEDEKLTNPLTIDGTATTGEEIYSEVKQFMGDMPFVETGTQPGVKREEERFFEIMKKVRERSGNDKFPTSKDEFLKQVQQERREVAQRAKSINQRYDGFTGGTLLAGLGSELPHMVSNPYDLGAIVGETALGTLAATMSGGLSIPASLAIAGAGGAGVEILRHPVVEETHEKAGLEYTKLEAASNIIGAGALGAGFELGGRVIGKAASKAFGSPKELVKEQLQGMTKEQLEKLDAMGKGKKNLLFAKKALEQEDFARKSNPFNTKNYGQEADMIQVHVKNQSEAEEKVLDDAIDEIDAEQGDIKRTIPLEEKNKEIPLEDLKVERTIDDIDAESNSPQAIIWEEENGTKHILDGTSKVAKSMDDEGTSRVQGILLKESDGVTKDMAVAFKRGRLIEEGELEAAEALADIAGINEEAMEPMKQSMVARDGDDFIEGLSDEAKVQFSEDDEIDFHIAAEVGAKIDDPDKQLKAMELTKEAETRQEASMIIEEAQNKGFDNVDPVASLEKRDTIIEETIDKITKKGAIETDDGTEVPIDDELRRGLRRLSRESGQFSESVNRRVAQSGAESGEGTLESNAAELATSIRERIKNGDISRDSLRQAGKVEANTEGPGSRTASEKFQQRAEQLRGHTYAQGLREDVIGDLSDLRQKFEEMPDEQLEKIEIPSNKANEEKRTLKDALDELEEDKKANKEMKDCLL